MPAEHSMTLTAIAAIAPCEASMRAYPNMRQWKKTGDDDDESSYDDFLRVNHVSAPFGRRLSRRPDICSVINPAGERSAI